MIRLADNHFTFDFLANGFVLVTSLYSGLRGLYNPDGTRRSGDLSPRFIPLPKVRTS